MSKESPPRKKVKVEVEEEEAEAATPSSVAMEPDEGIITGVVSAEKGKRLKTLAEKLWERDANKAGLEGIPLDAAVIAAMTDRRLAPLPDPLSHPPGATLDPNSWIQHGVDAGLWIEDEECMLLDVSTIVSLMSKDGRKNQF